MEHRFPNVPRGRARPESLANEFAVCFVVVLITSPRYTSEHVTKFRLDYSSDPTVLQSGANPRGNP
jgi:hypothetical protein